MAGVCVNPWCNRNVTANHTECSKCRKMSTETKMALSPGNSG